MKKSQLYELLYLSLSIFFGNVLGQDDLGTMNGFIDGDSSQQRKPIIALSHSNDVLVAADLSSTLPSGPLKVTREWLNLDGYLALRFNLSNAGNSTIEIGSLGFPAKFNSTFTHHHPADAMVACSLSEPYIGMDSGQIRVTPIKGKGSALVVTALIGTN
ncbi:glycoside hydrolase family 43 protein [Colletotrichum scovillei]|nr:glycoside hydrolase family 43 protein [Colletotrichum scovillei]KAG7060421.1 glycoside hydrolase family 43 protein [Colletotrichum scovillei]